MVTSSPDTTTRTMTQAPFGTAFAPQMVQARFVDGRWLPAETVPVAPLSIHPGAHVLQPAPASKG